MSYKDDSKQAFVRKQLDNDVSYLRILNLFLLKSINKENPIYS